jgi:DNA-binding response OmpR family regulator
MVVPRPLVAVVDDDLAFTALIQDFLEGEGYETLLIHESAGAVSALRAAQPALVILDIRMEYPEAGKDILNVLRATAATINLPVLVCSADQVFLREHREDLEHQHAYVLPKPFDLDDLLDLVHNCIGASPPGTDWRSDGRDTVS